MVRRLMGFAVGVMLVIGAGGLVSLRNSGNDPTFDLAREPFLTGSPSPLPGSASPLPTALPSFAFNFPTWTPAPSATPASARPVPTPTATAARPLAPATTTPAPAAPAKARALPANCASYPQACAYPGAKHAVTTGVKDLACQLTGSDGIRITWGSDNLTARGAAPAVEEFVARLWRHPAGSDDDSPQMRGADRLYQVRLGRQHRYVTITNLMEGERYACFVQELNAGGLSASAVQHLRIPGAAATPEPTVAPTATPQPSPTPTPTPSPTP